MAGSGTVVGVSLVVIGAVLFFGGLAGSYAYNTGKQSDKEKNHAFAAIMVIGFVLFFIGGFVWATVRDPKEVERAMNFQED